MKKLALALVVCVVLPMPHAVVAQQALTVTDHTN
jgi:hypothetical protein